jgi:hypothetical protein
VGGGETRGELVAEGLTSWNLGRDEEPAERSASSGGTNDAAATSHLEEETGVVEVGPPTSSFFFFLNDGRGANGFGFGVGLAAFLKLPPSLSLIFGTGRGTSDEGSDGGGG